MTGVQTCALPICVVILLGFSGGWVLPANSRFLDFARNDYLLNATGIEWGKRLGRAAPGLRLDLPDAISARERVRKGTGPNYGLALNRDSESPRYDSICGRALDIPRAHLVGQVFFGDTEVLTPFLYVSESIGRSIWIQPAIGCNAVDDDRGVPENAEEKFVVLGVEALDVGLN